MNIDKNVEEVKDTVDSNDIIEVAMNIDKNVEEVKDTLDTNDVIDGDVNIDKSSKSKEKIDQTDSKVAMSQNSKIDLLKIYTIVDLFQEMGFVKQDCPEIERDIPNGSLTLLGENHKITKWCESKAHIKPGRTTENKYKVCKITGNKRVKLRYNDGAYEVYTHAFGWDKAKEHDLRNLSHVRKQYAKEHSGSEFVYKGFGARTTIENKDLAMFDYDIPVPESFRQQTYSTENNCAWLSTALIVRSIDVRDGQQMIDLFLQNKQKFEWMSIKGNKSKGDHHSHKMSLMYGTETLQEKLQRDVGYSLKKVSKPANRCYKNYLIHDNKKGKFIVMLKLTDGQYSHVVGVDCELGKIYDCMEDYALELHSDNFDFCGGTEGVKVESIPICFELVDNLKKRPWN